MDRILFLTMFFYKIRLKYDILTSDNITGGFTNG